MKLFQTISGALVAFSLAAPAWAEKLPLSAISDYFNNMSTAQATFVQHNDDGSQTTGQMFIRRPGRIRFEYAAPNDSLVLASGGQVAIFDPKSNQPPERFPLNKTPLKLILAQKVDLTTANMVVGHTEDAQFTSVFAQDPNLPELGTLQLVFSDNPVVLRHWIVTDGSGQKTTVVLGDFQYNQTLRNRLFSIRSEMTSRGFKAP
jgi:outer membrane lipoprotein-sorting protein